MRRSRPWLAIVDAEHGICTPCWFTGNLFSWPDIRPGDVERVNFNAEPYCGLVWVVAIRDYSVIFVTDRMAGAL